MKWLFFAVAATLLFAFLANAQIKKVKLGDYRFVALRFTPDNKQLIVADGGYDGVVRGYDVVNAKQLWEINVLNPVSPKKHAGNVSSMDVSPDGRFVAIGYDIGEISSETGRIGNFQYLIELFEIATQRSYRVLRGHTKNAIISSLDFSPDGRKIVSASGGGDETVRVWDIGTAVQLFSIPLIERGRIAKFSPDGKLIAVATIDPPPWKPEESKIGLYNAQSGELVRRLTRSHNTIGELDFSPDGRFLAIGSNGSKIGLNITQTGANTAQIQTSIQQSTDASLDLWKLGEASETPAASYAGQDINQVAFSPSGLLAISDGRIVSVINISTSKEVQRYKIQSDVSALAFSPDEKLLAVGGSKGIVTVFEVKPSSK